MRRILLAIVAALGLILGVAAPASAADYGRPSGRWFEAIVSHEVGHCLGWWRHKPSTSSSIMRSRLNPYWVNAGYDTYRPTSNDLYEMNRSRQNVVSGERSTYWVQHPFYRDSVPIYNKTGRSSAFTAANRWEPGALYIWQTYTEPAHGITIRWDWSLAGTLYGGKTTASFAWNGSFWQVSDCVVGINPDVET